MNRVYLMGIGGIGMSNLAVLLKESGFMVSGSDEKIYEPAASILRSSGISVKTPYKSENLPDEDTPIIVGNAISRGHVEIEVALNRNLELFSFPEFLFRNVIRDRIRIVVAGTHGKSTTTACLAHLLSSAGDDPGFLIGASPLNFDFGGHAGHGKPFVLEGDEYDSAFFDKRSKFLSYFPNILLLGAVEFDHADIFPDLEEMLVAYRRLIRLLPENGSLIYFSGNPNTVKLVKSTMCKTISVGFNESDDWQLLPGSQFLLWRSPDRAIQEESFSQLGRHNRLNALMSLAAASVHNPASTPKYISALSSFNGIRRRLEKLHESANLTVYDDFAHHPTAVTEAISAVRERHPSSQIIAVFEPRSNTSVRNVFQSEFTKAFSLADHLVLGSIHRLEKIPLELRFNPDQIISSLRFKNISAVAMENSAIPDYLRQIVSDSPTVILFMSNGGFDNVPRQFLNSLAENKKFSVTQV